MTATIHCFGILKSYTNGETEVIVEAGRTVREAVAELGIPVDIVAMVVVNDEPRDPDYHLQDGDTVKLVTVVGGG
jgi:sulfur carrier protein ThiS